MKETTKIWLENANNDLALVKDIIRLNKHLEMIAFHLQQALEKTIKAYLEEKNNERPPKIHNLIGLVSIAKLELPKEEISLLEDLNFTYTESRYTEDPQELRDFLEKIDLLQLLNKTERLMEWIKSKL